MKNSRIVLLATLLTLSTHAQNRSVLLEIALQYQGNKQNFSYTTSPLLPLGENSKLPLRAVSGAEGELELQIIPSIPTKAPGKNLVEIQIDLVQSQNGTSKSLGQVKVLTRLHESAAVQQKKNDGSKLDLTITPLEIQNP